MKFFRNKGEMYGNMEEMYKFSDLAKQGICKFRVNGFPSV